MKGALVEFREGRQGVFQHDLAARKVGQELSAIEPEHQGETARSTEPKGTGIEVFELIPIASFRKDQGAVHEIQWMSFSSEASSGNLVTPLTRWVFSRCLVGLLSEESHGVLAQPNAPQICCGQLGGQPHGR